MGVLKAKVGGAWVPISQGWSPLAGGLVGWAKNTANQVVPGGYVVTDVTSLSVTFTASPTRTYRTTIALDITKRTNPGAAFTLLTDGAGTALNQRALPLAAGASSFSIVEHIESGLSGSVTRKARVSCDTTDIQVNASSGGYCYIVVEDITTVAPGPTQDTPWTGVTFQNGWANYGSGYQTCQYRKIGDVVQLRGVATNATGNTVAFTLPAGYRPPAVVELTTHTGAAALARITVDSIGQCTLQGAGNVWIGSWFSTVT